MTQLLRIELNSDSSDATSFAAQFSPLIGTGCQVAEDPRGFVWVKLPADCDAWRHFPGQCFQLSETGFVYQAPGTVAVDRINEELKWASLDKHVTISSPVAQWAGRLEDADRIPLRWTKRPVPEDQVPDGMIVDLAKLSTWIDSATESCFRGLRWIVDQPDNRALLIGSPLPPLDGIYLRTVNRIILPFQIAWTPEIPASELRDLHGCKDNDWLVWWEESSPMIVPDDTFASMVRAAVRLSMNPSSLREPKEAQT